MGATKPPTWRDLHDDARRRLRDAGVDSPAAEARWFLEHVSGEPGDEVIVSPAPATRRGTVQLEGLLTRRLEGEPLQYVLGEWAFREHDLLVDRRVLIPRPETEVVVELALAEVERLGERRGRPDPWGAAITTFAVADLGTGSGAIAIALERSLPEAEVWATDLSPDALAVARANIAGTGASRVRTAEGHWFEALDDALRGELLLVVSNPPYIAESEVDALPAAVIEWEPYGALISGPTGLEAITRILGEAPVWLAPGGVVVLEHAPHQAEAVVGLARDAGFVEARVEADLTGRPRALVARRH